MQEGLAAEKLVYMESSGRIDLGTHVLVLGGRNDTVDVFTRLSGEPG